MLESVETTRLRVVMVAGSLPEMPCGVGDHAGRLAAALGEAGAEVHVVTSLDDCISDIPGVFVRRCVPDWSIRRIPRLIRAIRDIRPDVLHVQYPTTGYRHGLAPGLLLPLARALLPRARVVLSLHEFVHAAPLHKPYVAAAVQWAHVVVTPDLDQLRGLPMWHRRIVCIPLASNIAPMATEQSGAADRELVVGTWGFLRADKGIDRLIEAFEDILAITPARLVIAGDPGPHAGYVSEIRRQVDASPARDRISFTGRLAEAELSTTLGGFDVCVLPYAAGLEAHRGTYETARAHGLSIVTTTTGEAGYEPESNTTRVIPGDREALARAILTAAKRPRQPLRDSASAWRRVATAHLRAYESVRGQREPATDP